MSSSSKFFTWHPSWTKTPHIPAEKSMSRPKRKPIPLDFEPRPQQRSSRTTDSIALQDAAVQSATSLLAVMNDCLNTHLLTTQQSSGGLKPGSHGRQRSHTAPSTPMAEAPHPSLTELEGSIPPRSAHSYNRSLDGNLTSIEISSPNALYGATIQRSHSSPQEAQYSFPVQPRKSHESFSRGSATYPPADPILRAKDSSPFQRVKTQTTTITSTSEDTLVAAETETAVSNGKRPSLSAMSSGHQRATSNSGSQQESQAQSTHAVPQIPPRWRRPSSSESAEQHADPLIEQIAALRASHDAHIAALKETHERELASQRSYIFILEKWQSKTPAARPAPRRTLTIDTQAAGQGGGLLSSDASATTSLQSFELSMEQKRVSSEAAAETEALKRKLSLARKTTAEIGDVRRERDQLRETNEKNDRRIIQLKEIIRKHKDTEKSLKNAVGSYEAALLAANNQRLDALEGFYEACEQVNKTSQREKFLHKELDDIQSLLSHVDPKWIKREQLKQSNDGQEILLKRRKTLRQDPLLQQMDELRRLVAEKDMRISELEQAAQDTNAVRQQTNDAEAELDKMRQKVADVEAARDKYNSLLHTELRRQSRSAAQNRSMVTPQLEDQASAAFVQRVRKMSISSAEKGKFELVESTDNQLSVIEKELKHCMQEIILYKLDIKGYKRDLKNANAEIEALRIAAQPQRAGCETTVPSTTRSSRQLTPIPPPHDPGLGISWPVVTTPQKTIAHAASQAFLTSVPTPQPPSASLATPLRPKTPLGTHKKLPNPPSSTSPSPSPRTQPASPPTRDIQRQETLRSLSESIISSYAKRTPEQGRTPPRGRSSDPPRTGMVANEVVPMPVRYRPVILKTPTRAVGVMQI